LARIQAVHRRNQGHPESVFRIGDLTVAFDNRSVRVGSKRVHVTPNEYGILELLCQRRGTDVRKETIFNHLYAGRDEPEPKIIDVFVCKLRKKLSAASGGENYIETVWGRGYMLREPAPQTFGNHTATADMPEHVAA
jgi:two-component system cell cycle response regulator CtrA